MPPIYDDDHARDKQNEGFNPATAGLICFFIGIVPLFFLSFFWLPFAGVLLFVTFVLAIVALSKGRVASGAIMLCAVVIIGPVACLFGPMVLPLFLAAKEKREETARLAQFHTPTPVAESSSVSTPRPTPTPYTPAPPAFAQDVIYSQQAAVRKYPQLGVKGSPMNVKFLARLAQWKTAHDPRLNRSDWPGVLADECAVGP